MSEKESEKTRKRRRPRKRTTRSTEEKWEAVRKGAWLRELLSSSSEDEEGAEEKRAKVEEKYMRFEESRRWIKEMTNPDQECETQVGTEATSTRGEEGQGQGEDHQQQLSTDEMLGILDLLEGRVEAIGTRLEQIKFRMREL
jgi:hypothetical protein